MHWGKEKKLLPYYILFIVTQLLPVHEHISLLGLPCKTTRLGGLNNRKVTPHSSGG